jgi:hypothetical protein
MEDLLKKRKFGGHDGKFKNEIYSRIFKAGQRTYFFDVKSTRDEEYYITITESKKFIEPNGNSQYEKHKIFLYREDFEKFYFALQEVMDYILDKQPFENDKELPSIEMEEMEEEISDVDFTNISFEDLAH